MRTRTRKRTRLLTLIASSVVAVPLATLGLGAAVAPIASADQSTDYLFNSSTGYTGNASDPDVEPCWYNNQSGYCMYTSQDLGQSGSGCNGGFPMNQTLGFWSPDGASWTYEGVVFSENSLPASYKTCYNSSNHTYNYPQHLWAPDVNIHGSTYYLFDPDLTNAAAPDTSSVAVIATSSSPFGPFQVQPQTLQGDTTLNGGNLSDPDIDRVGGYGGETDYMVYANGDGNNCGDLSLGVLNSDWNGWANGTPGKEIYINGMWGEDGFVTDNNKCTQHAYMEGPQLYYTGNWGLGAAHPGEPGQFILIFAAKPAVTPEQCGSSFGQPGSSNEVIAYATASSIDTSDPQFYYGGILMCGSSTDYTDQASLMPMQNGAIALVYHDGPSGSIHKRKVHAQCIAYGDGMFATASRPQGSTPTFGQCTSGSMFGNSVIVDPSASKWYGSGSQAYTARNFVVSSMINTSGYANGELATTGRTAAGLWETFKLENGYGSVIDPSQFPTFDSSSWSDLALVANANNDYVMTAGNNQIWADAPQSSGGYPYYPYNITAQWGNNVRGFQTTNVFLSIGDSTGTYGISSPSAPGPLVTSGGSKAYNILGYYGASS